MATSLLVWFKSALLDALKAAPELAGVQIVYGYPTSGGEAELVYYGNTTGRHDPGAIRRTRQPRDEQFTLDVFVEVVDQAGDAVHAESRVLELFAVVENLLADNPTLGNTAVSHARIGDW